MESAITALAALPSNKKEGELFAEMLKKEIPADRLPLNVLIQLKVLEKVLKDVFTDDYLDTIYLEEFRKFAKDNKLTINDTVLISQEFGVKYDYSHDLAWIELDKQIKELADAKKSREEQLKSDGIKIPGKKKVVVKL